MNNIGLYIHIPFCSKKCLYCDFNSYEGQNMKAAAYVNALIKEIKYYEKNQFNVKTIFIGGGTPTLINCLFIGEILDALGIRDKEDMEITIECNPGTVNRESLLAYRNFGINRLSIGLQAWQDPLLEKIGRIHTRDQFLRSFHAAREAGFKNINIDLMFALPGQTLEIWEETLLEVCSLGIEHISCYSLKLEEGTAFYKMHQNGEIILPDDDADREMYDSAIRILKCFGLEQYEISNFSKPGYECRHNLIYWRNEDYLGVGAGSHSKLFGKRFWNIKGLDSYIEVMKNGTSPVEGEEILSMEDNMWESLFLGLRLNEGLDIQVFEKQYKIDFLQRYGEKINKLVNNDLISKKGNIIKLTRRGIDISNSVFVELG